MTQDELRLFCTALGFVTALLKDEPIEAQTTCAKAFARSIESFCITTLPAAMARREDGLVEDNDATSADAAIDHYKTELVKIGSARLPSSRTELLRMYDRLLVRRIREEQKNFYKEAQDAFLADQILRLIDQEIAAEEALT